MQDTLAAVRDFFRVFEHNTNQGDNNALVALAPAFLVAGPQGANCVRREDFALVVPKRKELFDKLGCKSTELTQIDAEMLDERYSLARTQWKMSFSKDGESRAEVVVASAYVVDTGVNPFQIVFYLSHQDIMAVLKERGLMQG